MNSMLHASTEGASRCMQKLTIESFTNLTPCWYDYAFTNGYCSKLLSSMFMHRPLMLASHTMTVPLQSFNNTLPPFHQFS